MDCSPFYGRACRWAMLGELKPKGPKGCDPLFYRTSSSVRLWWELEEPKGPKGSERKHGLSTEQVPASVYVGSSKNLKDLKAVHQEGIVGTKSEGSTVHRGTSPIRNRQPP